MCMQEEKAEKKKMAALGAQLQRICTPKPSSGRLDVNPEIYAQWSRGGAERTQLLKLLASTNGDKERACATVRLTCGMVLGLLLLWGLWHMHGSAGCVAQEGGAPEDPIAEKQASDLSRLLHKGCHGQGSGMVQAWALNL